MLYAYSPGLLSHSTSAIVNCRFFIVLQETDSMLSEHVMAMHSGVQRSSLASPSFFKNSNKSFSISSEETIV